MIVANKIQPLFCPCSVEGEETDGSVPFILAKCGLCFVSDSDTTTTTITTTITITTTTITTSINASFLPRFCLVVVVKVGAFCLHPTLCWFGVHLLPPQLLVLLVLSMLCWTRPLSSHFIPHLVNFTLVFASPPSADCFHGLVEQSTACLLACPLVYSSLMLVSPVSSFSISLSVSLSPSLSNGCGFSMCFQC